VANNVAHFNAKLINQKQLLSHKPN